MLRGVVYRLIEYLASMGHSSMWKLICAISVSNILTVGVHLSSTPSIRGPGSATAYHDKGPLPPMLMTVLHKISILIWMSSAYFVCTQMTAP